MAAEQTRIVVRRRPAGVPDLDDFGVETGPVASPAPGEVLIRVIHLGLDPYLRGRMGTSSLHSSSRPPVELGAVMEGWTVGQVVVSAHPDLPVGEFVVGPGGWQEYAILDAGVARRLDPAVAPISCALSMLGMPGLTGYVAVREIGRPQPGETVVVAAATGTVGSLAAQLARISGARVVAVAGGPTKVAWLRKAGFEAVDHRDPDFRQHLAAATPNGIDLYVENVGGRVTDAVWPRLNRRARVAVCGVASAYNSSDCALDLNRDGFMSELVTKGISMQGFAYVDFEHLRPAFESEVGDHLRTGAVTYHEDVVDGLSAAPQAFLGMLAGDHLGKRIIRVSEDPTAAALS